MEWWMKRRQLPSRLRQRVRQYERQRWAAMRGEDEVDLVKDLPEGLRRDIRRHLCLDLIKQVTLAFGLHVGGSEQRHSMCDESIFQVPLFQNLDDLILDNICDRVKHMVFSKDEKVRLQRDPNLVFFIAVSLTLIPTSEPGDPRRRPRAVHDLRRPRAPAEQPTAQQRGGGDVHAGPWKLPRR